MKLCHIAIVSRKPMLWFAAAALATAPATFAHAGFNHVFGTVAKVSDHVLTIKTSTGDVGVKLTETELTRKDRKAQIADLKPGTRVVAEVPEEGTDKVAQSVRIGGARPQGAAARRSHAYQK